MAVTDGDGKALISELPEGTYTFKLWHERAKRKTQFSEHEVFIGAAGTTVYDLSINLGRERRIRRAPSGTLNSYH